MECPHVAENSLIQVVKVEDIKRCCSECSASDSLWYCIACGAVNCGRYIKGHAMRHFECFKDHQLSISIDTAAIYCYKCDRDVYQNIDREELQQLRQSIIYCTSKPEDCSPRSDGGSASDNSSNAVDETAGNDSRKLRPRKRPRDNSMDSNDDGAKRSVVIKPEKTYEERRRAVGLRNLGNTCFMNAVLQSLNNLNPFLLYMKQLPSFEKHEKFSTWSNVRQSRNSKEITDALMAEELRKIILSLNEEYSGSSSRTAISPESLFMVIWKVVPRFRGYQQQDAHEFLRYMLDRLHMELLLLLPEFTLKDVNIGQKGRASIITCVFGGVLQSDVRCLNCSLVSKKQDPFLDISLDIPDKFLPKFRKTAEEPVQACTINDCLSSFVDVEELADTELYYCNNCKSKERSTKKFWIRRLPNVLCLHLKRFRWVNYYRTKVDVDITFPIEGLDVSEFVLRDMRDTRQSGAGSNLYDLAAVIVHHGSGTGSGHYTAFAINNGRWYHFNDSSVQTVPTETVAKCKPYILFYIRREVRLPKLFDSGANFV